MRLIVILLLFSLKSASQGFFAYDKRLHMAAGAAISLPVCLSVKDTKKSFIYGVALATAVGVAKEAYDLKTGRGNAEVMDIVATTTGALVVSTISLVVRNKIKSRKNRKHVSR